MRRLSTVAAVCLLATACPFAGIVAAVAQPGSAGLESMTLEDLPATRELPLFTPARHPPLPPPPPPPPPPKVVEKPERKPPAPKKPPQLRLIGVMMTDDRNVAIMMGKKRETHRIAVGDEIEGWEVVAVEPNSVELQFRKEKRVYRMFRSRVKVPEVRDGARAQVD